MYAVRVYTTTTTKCHSAVTSKNAQMVWTIGTAKITGNGADIKGGITMLNALIVLGALLLIAAALIIYGCAAADSDANNVPPSDDYPEEWRWNK